MKKNYKYFKVFLLATFSSIMAYAQDPVIGKYEFTGGSTQPVFQADGVTFGDEFEVWNTTTNPAENVFDNVNGYLIAKNSGTGVSPLRYGWLSITPDPGKTVQITKVEVLHKKGNANTSRVRCYLYDEIKNTPTILSNLIYTGSGGFVIPSDWTRNSFAPSTSGKISFDVKRYMSIGVTQTTQDLVNLAEWMVDELIFYGTVFTEGEVIVSSSLPFGDNNTLNTPVEKTLELKGYNTVGGVTLSIEGDDAAIFSLSNTSFTETEINAGVTVTVTYTPTTVDAHAASIKVSYAAADKYVSLSGAVPVLFETFDTQDMTGLNNNSPLVSLSDFTVDPGWLTENINLWHKSGSYGFAPALISNVDTVAKLTTPALDLSKPFQLTFLGKRINNENNGESFMLVDQDTIFKVDNPNNSFRAISVDGYIASSNSRISFSGKGVVNNQVAFDNIRISYTTSPTLSIPYSSKKNFGVVVPSGSTTIDIPLKAYNLTGDLTVSTPVSGVFELLSGTAITKTAAESESGTTIQVRFNPTGYESYTDKIVISGGGLMTNGASGDRTIYLMGEGGISTHADANRSQPQIILNDQSLSIMTQGNATIELYDVTGNLRMQKNFSNAIQTIIRPGIYVIRVREQEDVFVRKIIVR